MWTFSLNQLYGLLSTKVTYAKENFHPNFLEKCAISSVHLDTTELMLDLDFDFVARDT